MGKSSMAFLFFASVSSFERKNLGRKEKLTTELTEDTENSLLIVVAAQVREGEPK